LSGFRLPSDYIECVGRSGSAGPAARFRLTDAQLVQSARASDADAWRRLYERYLPLVWRRAYALVGDVHAAEDVTSETMLALVRNLDRLAGDAACVAGWLASVVSRQAAEHHRQVYRARDKLAAAATMSTSAAGDGPSAPLEIEETRREVLRALDELPERLRLALEWKYLEGLGVREIAERLGESERAVEAVLYRARRGFRQLFDRKRTAK
jgi:RNA polymerase sigma-70 factor, ECF subfamily